MSKRELIYTSHDETTKMRILSEATKLFALQGFEAVSIRDIGKAVGIRSSSIYKHYTNKDTLFDAVLSHFESSYRAYFAWLTAENRKAASLEGVLDNMFAELLSVRDIATYYGIVLVIKEQFRHERARQLLLNLLYVESVRNIRDDFDRLVSKGIIPPCNTQMIATVFMRCVLSGNELRIHEIMHHDMPIDTTALYHRLKSWVASMLKSGI